MCMLPKTAIWDYGLRGHDDLQIASVASKVELDFRFGINNLKYPDIHVHVA